MISVMRLDVLQALSDSSCSLGLVLNEERRRARLFKLQGPLVQAGYVAAILDEQTQTAEIIAVWDVKGRPVWASPRVIEEPVWHAVKRAEYHTSHAVLRD